MQRFYPEVWKSKNFEAHYAHISTLTFSDLQKEAGYNMKDENTRGWEERKKISDSKDTRFISFFVQRLLQSEGTLVQVRQFLWDEIDMNELFTGTGQTMDDKKVSRVCEYLCGNRPLQEIPGREEVDL